MLQIEISEPKPVVEELEEYKVALFQAEEDKKALLEELRKITLRNKELEDEIVFKTATVEESSKRCKKEEQMRLEVQKYLKDARDELKKCSQKARKANEEAKEWKELWEKADLGERAAKSMLTKAKQEARLAMAKWEDQLQSVKRDRTVIEEILKEYQQALRFEQRKTSELRDHLRNFEEAYRQVNVESKHWQDRYLELLGRIKDQVVIVELKDEIQYWKDKFSRLSELANQAIMNVPRNLKKAEAEMHFLNTPPEVFKFVEFCRDLVTEFKKKTQEAAANKKRKRDGNLKALCH